MSICEDHGCFRTATHSSTSSMCRAYEVVHLPRWCGEEQLNEDKRYYEFAKVKLVALQMDRWAHPW
jgi:hypothetical protein